MASFQRANQDVAYDVVVAYYNLVTGRKINRAFGWDTVPCGTANVESDSSVRYKKSSEG